MQHTHGLHTCRACFCVERKGENSEVKVNRPRHGTGTCSIAAISFIKESEYENTYQLKSNSFLGTTRNFSFRGRIGSALLKINLVFLHRNVICHPRDIWKVSFCIMHLDQTGKWKHFLFHVPTSSQNVCVFHLWTSGSTGRYLSPGSVKRKFLSFEEKLT